MNVAFEIHLTTTTTITTMRKGLHEKVAKLKVKIASMHMRLEKDKGLKEAHNDLKEIYTGVSKNLRIHSE